MAWLVVRDPGVAVGSYRGVSTWVWLGWAIAVPILHQLWVVACWRLELHRTWLSRHLGAVGFRIYVIGFVLFSVARFVTLIAVSTVNRGTIDGAAALLNAVALLIALLSLYAMYSVARYFTFRRAVGIDHFDRSYRDRPLVREGIFRFTRNGMYTFGMSMVWLPGLLLASKAGLLAAAFSHLYIWVHYLCTELPDMRHIYRDAAIRAERR